MPRKPASQPPLPPAVPAGPGQACPCCGHVMRRWRLVGDVVWDECTAAGCGSPPTLMGFAIVPDEATGVR
jgi:hypothetical protein